MDMELMMENLGSDSLAVRRDAVEKILECGEAAVPFLLRGLKSENRNIRYGSVNLLGRMKIEHSFDALLEILNVNDVLFKEKALAALFSIDETKAFPLIEKVLQEEEIPWIKERCVDLLSDADDRERAIEYLKETAKDSDSYVKSSAVRALKKLGCPEFLDSVMKNLVSKLGGDCESEAAREMLCYAEDSFPYLIEGLDSDDNYIRVVCIKLLRLPAARDAFSRLLELTEDSDAVVRAEALWSVYSIDPEAGFRFVIEALENDDSSWVRYKVGNLLELAKMQGDRDSASDSLIKAVEKDPDPGVREICADVLGICSKTDDIITCLKGVLASDENMKVRVAAAGALGKHGNRDGHKTALEVMIDESMEHNDETRSKAAETLGFIGVDDDETLSAIEEYLEDECPAYGALKKLKGE